MEDLSVMESQILRFCTERPRTLKDVCLAHGLVSSVGYNTLMRLVGMGWLVEEYNLATGGYLFRTGK